MLDVAKIEIAKLELKPDDILVIKFPNNITRRAVSDFSSKLAESISNIIIVFIGDVELSVIEKNDA